MTYTLSYSEYYKRDTLQIYSPFGMFDTVGMKMHLDLFSEKIPRLYGVYVGQIKCYSEEPIKIDTSNGILWGTPR